VLNRTRILSTLQHMHVAVLSLKMRHNKKILTEHWQRFSAQHSVKVKHSIHVGPEVNSPTADAYRKCSFCTCSSQNTIKKKISLNQSCDLTSPQFQFWYVHFPERLSGWTANVWWGVLGFRQPYATASYATEFHTIAFCTKWVCWLA
jgi:hypothetical protein